MKKRCSWVNLENPVYVDYHDKEWGKKNHNDKYLFELLVLESFQAGLSWECVLNKRENFRKAFDNFEINKIIGYDDDKVDELLNNREIIRNRLKIKAMINNAKVFSDIQKEYQTFNNYIWHFTKEKVIQRNSNDITTTSSLSDEISKNLKKRGMKFIGSTIIYSYLQAIGVINDHDFDCDCR